MAAAQAAVSRQIVEQGAKAAAADRASLDRHEHQVASDHDRQQHP